MTDTEKRKPKGYAIFEIDPDVLNKDGVPIGSCIHETFTRSAATRYIAKLKRMGTPFEYRISTFVRGN